MSIQLYHVEVLYQGKPLRAMYNLTSDQVEEELAKIPGLSLEDYNHSEGWYCYSNGRNITVNVEVH